jgi:hypothetical protein
MGDVHNASYYSKCMMGGILSCGITHTLICPLDIVKCRKQINPDMYKTTVEGLKTIKAAEGFRGLTVVIKQPLMNLRDGFQPSLDTPCKDSESSDSMKSSKMSSLELLDQKKQFNIEP